MINCAIEVVNLNYYWKRRRCGWFDGIIGKYAVSVNGLDCLAVTKLDVLDELDEIQVCIAYELDGEEIDFFPTIQTT